jgi:hypothetical protein
MKIGNKYIMAAIIGGVFVVIGAVVTFVLVYYNTEQEVQFILRNAQTQERIYGRIYVDGSTSAITTDPENLQITVFLKRGRHEILAESYGYYPKTDIIGQLAKSISIYLEQRGEELIPLSLVGWQPWYPNITIGRGSSDNECIVNSDSVVTNGFNNTTLNTSLRGRTLVLFFANTDESVYTGDRLVKLTYNKSDITLMPVNAASLLYGEYLPRGNTPVAQGIEFLIPDDFDGKINLMFYQADLNNLKITAYYK